jgi:hypothetical protein
MPLTQRSRKACISAALTFEVAETLHFLSLFSSDFGPIALLNLLTAVHGLLSYGEEKLHGVLPDAQAPA